MPFPIAFDTHVCPYVQRFRESEALIIAVGFLAVMIDMLTDACLIVVLPCMLTEIEDGLICDRNSTGLVQVTGIDIYILGYTRVKFSLRDVQIFSIFQQI